jgi:hypothetical protein
MLFRVSHQIREVHIFLKQYDRIKQENEEIDYLNLKFEEDLQDLPFMYNVKLTLFNLKVV